MMKGHYTCLRCSWSVFGMHERYEGSYCPECGGEVIPRRPERLRNLTPPPNILERLKAAVNYNFDYQVIHYNRLEGASTAAVEIAKAGRNIAILSHRVHQSEFRDERYKFFDYESRIPDGLGNMIVIADVVPEIVLSRWRQVLLREGRGNKIIALKAIGQEWMN